MTLATADGQTHEPWSAPVYYVFRAGKFFFFSSPKSRHIESKASSFAAASIFADSKSVDGLLGLQMSGNICRCRAGGDAVRTAAAYAVKYGIPVKGENPIDYFVSVFHACLYVFSPEDVYFMNNSKGFGQRTPVRL